MQYVAFVLKSLGALAALGPPAVMLIFGLYFWLAGMTHDAGAGALVGLMVIVTLSISPFGLLAWIVGFLLERATRHSPNGNG